MDFHGFFRVPTHLKCIFHGHCMSWALVFWLGIFSKEFTGATLSFCGLVTDEKHRKMQHTYIHEKVRNIGSVFPIMSSCRCCWGILFFFLVLFFIHSWKKYLSAFDMPKLPPSGTCCDPPRWGSERHGIAEGKQMMIRKYTKSDARKTPPWTGPRFLKFCFHLFEIEKQAKTVKPVFL